MKKNEVLSIKGLSLTIKTPSGTLRPLRRVDLTVYEGEILVLLGESGAGKSLLAKTIMDILPGDVKISEGEVKRGCMGHEISMILQDPKKLLDPTMTVGKQVMESLKYKGTSRAKRKSEALKILREVSITDPEERFSQYVHELSGGLAQRAVMAVALAKSPKLFLADEPTSALDHKTEKDIIALLVEGTRKKAMTTVMITHSLFVAEKAADRIAVMYAGRIIEIGKKDEVLKHPAHPYTKALIRAASLTTDEEGKLETIKGMAPCPMDLFTGDPFAKRNPHALIIDHLEEPPMMRVTDTHYAATWLLDERFLKTCCR